MNVEQPRIMHSAGNHHSSKNYARVNSWEEFYVCCCCLFDHWKYFFECVNFVIYQTCFNFILLRIFKYCKHLNTATGNNFDRYLYDYDLRLGLVNNNIILIIDTFMLTVSLWTERDISGVWMEFPFFSMHSFNHFESSRTWQWVQISRRCLLRLWLMMVMLRAHGLASSKVHRTEIRNEIVLLNLVYERSADSLCR